MKSIEMTSGSLWKNILLFSLPLMLTQVLEVLFNLSDVAIAGKYAYNTYGGAGVGSTTTLVSLFTGLLIGMGAGVNVSVARWLGIGDSENVERTTHSSLLICTGAGVLVCLICAFFAEPMLRLLNTKGGVPSGAVLYLRIYALGLPGIGIYNCGNGIPQRHRRYQASPDLPVRGRCAERHSESGIRHRLPDVRRGRSHRQRHCPVGIRRPDRRPPAAAEGRLPPEHAAAAAPTRRRSSAS